MNSVLYESYVARGGRLDEESFAAALPKAQSMVRSRTAAVPRGSLTATDQETVYRAVFAAVDALSDDTAGLASYSAGKVSATFSSSAYRSNTVEAAIERELSGTRLAGTAV